MKRHLRGRFYVESVIGAVAGALAVLTVFGRDWIEVSGWDPDHHDGKAEWVVVGVLLGVALVLSLVARREWLRLSRPLPEARS